MSEAEKWLERDLENYAMIAAMMIRAMMVSGKRLETRDLEPINEMIRTLATISNLLEKERKWSRQEEP